MCTQGRILAGGIFINVEYSFRVRFKGIMIWYDRGIQFQWLFSGDRYLDLNLSNNLSKLSYTYVVTYIYLSLYWLGLCTWHRVSNIVFRWYEKLSYLILNSGSCVTEWTWYLYVIGFQLSVKKPISVVTSRSGWCLE